jgi:hypothetical protein
VFTFISSGYQKKTKGIFYHCFKSVNLLTYNLASLSGPNSARARTQSSKGGGLGGEGWEGVREASYYWHKNWQNYWIPRKIKKKDILFGGLGEGCHDLFWLWVLLGFLGFADMHFPEMSEGFFFVSGKSFNTVDERTNKGTNKQSLTHETFAG